MDAADRARIERLEIFDEFEEWHMIQVRVVCLCGCAGTPGCWQVLTARSARAKGAWQAWEHIERHHAGVGRS